MSLGSRELRIKRSSHISKVPLFHNCRSRNDLRTVSPPSAPAVFVSLMHLATIISGVVRAIRSTAP